ncbi:hypothetical protein TMES_18775 [Thalassospira mesophila]|uniref:Uncharacterized protein n=2 Tax=Thalassospira mesophila TaxID=1293891 RepID=A0A1Y2KWC2_9PROT|nr:hypothetical protein TMES_18775 [Thalassospira mesophila]
MSQIAADSIMTTAFFEIQHGLILGVICFVGMGRSGGYLAALAPVGVIAINGAGLVLTLIFDKWR